MQLGVVPRASASNALALCLEDTISPEGFKMQVKGRRAKPGAVEIDGNS